MAQYYRKLSKGIKYYYKFDVNNKSYRSKCIYLSKKEASQAERERYNQLDSERRFGKQDNPLLLRRMIDDRLKYLSVKFSIGHKKDNEYYLSKFCDFIGDCEIREISRKDIEDFLLEYADKLSQKNVDNYQVNAALKTIKALFNYIIDSYDLSVKNPCRRIKPYPIKKKLKYIPSDEEINKLKTFLNPRQRLLIDFLMQTGLRVNEAINLTFEDIKENYFIAYTNKSKNSNRVPRKVDIPDCIKGLKGKGRVFPEWSELPKFLDHTLRANNMKVWGYHSLRHRFASRLSKQGLPIFDIMLKLGHHSLAVTQRYLQLLED